MGPSTHLWLCANKTACLAPILQVSMGPRPHLLICACKTASLATNKESVWVPAYICRFCIQNSDFMTRKTSLYGSLTSPVDLCMHNNVRSARITSLYGSQHSSGLFACKTACLEPELQVSMCRSPDLWFCAFKTATLGPELQVSMGPRSHLWFLC